MRSYVVIFLGLWLYGQALFAGACCASAAAFGLGRLMTHEDFALGLRTSYLREIGVYDESSYFQRYDSAYVKSELRSNLWVMVRTIDALSIFAQLPLVVPHQRIIGGAEYQAIGLGDANVGFRYEAIAIRPNSQIPGLALSVALEIPTAIGPKHVPRELYGRSAFGTAIGLSLDKSWHPWFLQSNLGSNIAFPSKVHGTQIARWWGASIEGNIMAGVEVIDVLVFSFLLGAKWQSPQKRGEDFIEESMAYKSFASFAAAWRFDPHWTLQSSLNADLMLPYLGQRTMGAVTANIGLRYGFFA